MKTHGTLQGKVWVKHEDENHQLRIGGGSWTINLDEIPPEAYIIKYVTEQDTYRITKVQAEEHGFRLLLGGEYKLVVPLKYWIKKGDYESDSNTEN